MEIFHSKHWLLTAYQTVATFFWVTLYLKVETYPVDNIHFVHSRCEVSLAGVTAEDEAGETRTVQADLEDDEETCDDNTNNDKTGPPGCKVTKLMEHTATHLTLSMVF